MTNPTHDPPLALATAEELFMEFLTRHGHPSKVRWILACNLVVDGSGRYWIRGRETQTDGTREATRRYSIGLERKIGVSLRAFCVSESETFAAVFIPSDSADAQYRLLGRSLKLSCPSERIPAHIVRNAILWFLLTLLHGFRTQMLEEL
jgi:hypothetical protein